MELTPTEAEDQVFRKAVLPMKDKEDGATIWEPVI